MATRHKAPQNIKGVDTDLNHSVKSFFFFFTGAAGSNVCVSVSAFGSTDGGKPMISIHADEEQSPAQTHKKCVFHPHSTDKHACLVSS